MVLRRVELRDVRAFIEAALEPAAVGTTVIEGPNGAGKTTVLEAVAFLGTQRSFRTTDREAIVRVGAPSAIIRAELERDDAPVLVETELPTSGRVRSQVNRQPVRDRRDLARAVPVTVFSPDDLAVVRGAPGNRRDLLDDTLRVLDARAGLALDQLDRVLRQRAALLRQAGGRLAPEVTTTLDVWDERLATAGGTVAEARAELVTAIAPFVAAGYAALAQEGAAAVLTLPPPADPAGGPAGAAVELAYRRSWTGDLAAALASRRDDDVRRGVTTTGPHRDDLEVRLAGRDARNQASQGEQRSLALALRLAVHRLVTERLGAPPLLLLDDVFSELDPGRSRALVAALPQGQALLTTAGPVPAGVPLAARVDVRTIGRRAAP